MYLEHARSVRNAECRGITQILNLKGQELSLVLLVLLHNRSTEIPFLGVVLSVWSAECSGVCVQFAWAASRLVWASVEPRATGSRVLRRHSSVCMYQHNHLLTSTHTCVCVCMCVCVYIHTDTRKE